MIVAYAEGQARHCGQIARMLRGEHAAAVLALGVDPHRELRAVLEASSFVRAMMIDGRLAALGGVAGPALASEGHVWLALARHATAHPRALLTAARQQFAEIANVKRVLHTTILDGDTPAMRFARHLGFVPQYQEAGPGLIPMRLDLGSRTL